MKVNRDFAEDQYVKKISGETFKDSGALWFVNQMLHLFGMALVYDPDTGEIFPAICRFRGFDNKTTEKTYQNLSTYLKDNIEELEKESYE